MGAGTLLRGIRGSRPWGRSYDGLSRREEGRRLRSTCARDSIVLARRRGGRGERWRSCATTSHDAPAFTPDFYPFGADGFGQTALGDRECGSVLVARSSLAVSTGGRFRQQSYRVLARCAFRFRADAADEGRARQRGPLLDADGLATSSRAGKTLPTWPFLD
jgi:hypothetical protein